MGGEVVVQEQLTSHKVKRKIMSCPAEEKEAGRIVESRSSSWAPDWGLDYAFVILMFVRVISEGGKGVEHDGRKGTYALPNCQCLFAKIADLHQ